MKLGAAGLTFVWVAVASAAARGADAPSGVPPAAKAAMETLTQKGLARLKPTAMSIPWVLANEAKVHDTLETFRKAETTERAAEKKVKDLAVSTKKDRDLLSKAEARYQELKGYADNPQTIPRKLAARFRNQPEMQKALQDDLNDQVVTINRLRPNVNGKFVGDMPPVLKTAITDWMTARNNLIMAYFTADPQFSELDKQYSPLREDAAVAAALKSLGKKHHLGSKDFEQNKKALAAAETTAFSGEVPFYREGNYDYVGALVNEATPVVLQIESVSNQSFNWAPAELLAKAGISLDAAPARTLTYNGKRTIPCRQVTIPKLRLGKYVLEDLKFLAMPDDAKDLGVQLLSKELAAYDRTPDLERWVLKFVKKDPTKPEDDQPAKP